MKDKFNLKRGLGDGYIGLTDLVIANGGTRNRGRQWRATGRN